MTMLEFTEKLDRKNNLHHSPVTTLTLPLDLRQKCRQRVMLDNGEEAAVILQRGAVLFHGDFLSTQNNIVIQVLAAEEDLSMVYCNDPLLFARACYHLGNRHMPLQIEENRFFYQSDHVLDHMLEGLGLTVSHVMASFEPEPGAYAGKIDHHAH